MHLCPGGGVTAISGHQVHPQVCMVCTPRGADPPPPAGQRGNKRAQFCTFSAIFGTICIFVEEICLEYAFSSRNLHF